MLQIAVGGCVAQCESKDDKQACICLSVFVCACVFTVFFPNSEMGCSRQQNKQTNKIRELPVNVVCIYIHSLSLKMAIYLMYGAFDIYLGERLVEQGRRVPGGASYFIWERGEGV